MQVDQIKLRSSGVGSFLLARYLCDVILLPHELLFFPSGRGRTCGHRRTVLSEGIQ